MKTIKIGSQVWTKKNLRVFKFRNGDHIPIVQSQKKWDMLESPAMCINPNNGECLYNWYAVRDKRGLTPEGFHIPSDDEWNVLTDAFGGRDKAGHHLKSYSKWDGDNSSGFNAVPTGFRNDNGFFQNTGVSTAWWTSDMKDSCVYVRFIDSGNTLVVRAYDYLECGHAVRLIKDAQ